MEDSVVFSGDGDGTPGWLVGCLAEFASRGVNLSRIESRPAKRRLGHYLFLVDAAGRADVPGAAPTPSRRSRAHCEHVRVLGSYPAADAPERLGPAPTCSRRACARVRSAVTLRARRPMDTQRHQRQ